MKSIFFTGSGMVTNADWLATTSHMKLSAYNPLDHDDRETEHSETADRADVFTKDDFVDALKRVSRKQSAEGKAGT